MARKFKFRVECCSRREFAARNVIRAQAAFHGAFANNKSIRARARFRS
jgi:hypothetical protein